MIGKQGVSLLIGKQGVQVKQALGAASETVARGIYDPTTLSAVDNDLASGNIKSGITIFSKEGSTNVRDSSDADLAVGEAPTGKTFYAGGGAKKTGSGTKTLNPANDTVEAGYYAATTLSAVDAHLVPENILSGVDIFGKVGTVAQEGAETFDSVTGQLAPGANYTPAESGIFFMGYYDFIGVQYKYNASWYYPYNNEAHESTGAIGDGTNMRLLAGVGGGEYRLFRHYYSNGTYERYATQDIAALGTYTPADGGYYTHGDENLDIRVYVFLAVHGWEQAHDAFNVVGIALSDGTNMYYKNIDAANAYETVIMRAEMV